MCGQGYHADCDNTAKKIFSLKIQSSKTIQDTQSMPITCIQKTLTAHHRMRMLWLGEKNKQYFGVRSFFLTCNANNAVSSLTHNTTLPLKEHLMDALGQHHQ